MQRPTYIPRYNPPVSPSRPRNPSSFLYSSLTSSASTVNSQVNNQTPPSESAPSPERIVTSHSCLPIFFWWRRQRKRPAHFSDEPAEDPQGHLAQLKSFSLPQLRVATNNFSREHILGEGGFGEVYKGRLADGSLIAVKRLNDSSRINYLAHFHIGVKTIHMAVHRNLLRLHGYCRTPTELYLVYPYMANGSVASCLRERSTNKLPLDWPTRRRIALGSATGLSYLHEHCDPKITHHDVRAQNVLLDEDFEAVVGDFGLANFIAYNGLRTRAPEYESTGTSSKTDVFDYGIVLLELLLGQRNSLRLGYDREGFNRVSRLLNQRRFDELVDPDLVDYDVAQVESHIQVGLLCTREHPLQRPKMSEVVRMLEGDDLTNRSDGRTGSRKASQNEKAWSRLLR